MVPHADQSASDDKAIDALTRLPSRHGLLARARLVAAAGQIAVHLVDIDGFRRVNRDEGHATADLLLFAVGRRLLAAAPRGAVVARAGGDEFAVLDSSPGAARRAEQVAEQLATAFDDRFDLGVAEVAVTASVGVATSLRTPHEVEAMLADAEAALERNPEGEGRIEIFDHELGERMRERVLIGRDLATALEQDQVRFHYQPIVDIASGRVVSTEILARWRHRNRGDISPGLFVPIAEESGSSSQLLERAIEHIAREFPAIAAADPTGRISVAVNVSAGQLISDHLPVAVTRLLDVTGLEPRRVVVEISETALAGAAEVYLRRIDALRILGVRISLDDFGTASTSIAQLRALPIDQIKLDRSFVAGLGEASADSALAAGILPMARALGIEVVAEGIETDHQLAHLFALGYRLGQGYLLARPMSAKDAAALISFGPVAAARGDESGELAAPRESFRRALLAGDAKSAERIVATALREGVDPVEIQAEVIGRALHWVETEREAGRLRVADQHLAAAICERQLTAVLDERRGSSRRFAPSQEPISAQQRARRLQP